MSVSDATTSPPLGSPLTESPRRRYDSISSSPVQGRQRLVAQQMSRSCAEALKVPIKRPDPLDDWTPNEEIGGSLQPKHTRAASTPLKTQADWIAEIGEKGKRKTSKLIAADQLKQADPSQMEVKVPKKKAYSRYDTQLPIGAVVPKTPLEQRHEELNDGTMLPGKSDTIGVNGIFPDGDSSSEAGSTLDRQLRAPVLETPTLHTEYTSLTSHPQRRYSGEFQIGDVSSKRHSRISALFARCIACCH